MISLKRKSPGFRVYAKKTKPESNDSIYLAVISLAGKVMYTLAGEDRYGAWSRFIGRETAKCWFEGDDYGE